MAITYDFTINTSSFVDGAKKCEESVSGISKAAENAKDNLKDILESAAALGGISLGVAGIKEFVTKVYEVRSYFQDINSSMVAFLGNEEKANKFTEELKDYAWYNMFEFSDLAKASQEMIAYGANVEDVITTLDKLSDIAVATKADLGELVSMYNRAKSVGSVDSQATRSWATHGLVIKDALKDMGEAASGSTFTFEQLEKVITHVTSEGGLFYQQQKKMMDNLSSSWGQLQDNIDFAFNEIGEDLQDTMKSGIDFMGELVDNYKEIGKTVMDMVAMYGAYRVALAATNGLKKIDLIIEQEAAVQRTLALAQGQALTISEAKQAAMTNLLAAAKMKLASSLKAVAASTLANPYVLATVAITGMVYGIYKLITAKSAEEKATEAVNKLMEKQAELEKERKDSLKSLLENYHDENQYQKDRLKSYQEIFKLFPELTKKEIEYAISLGKTAETIAYINELQGKRDAMKKKDLYDATSIGLETSDLSLARETKDRVAAINQVKEAFKKAFPEGVEGVGSKDWEAQLLTLKKTHNDVAKQIQEEGALGMDEKELEELSVTLEKVRQVIIDTGKAVPFTRSGVTSLYDLEGINDYKSAVDVALKDIRGAQEKANTHNKEYWEKQKKLYQGYIEGMNSETVDAIKKGTKKKGDADYDNYMQWVDNYKKAVDELKKYDLSENTSEKQLEKLRQLQELKELELKNQREIERQRKDSEHRATQIEIDAMREGTEKLKAQRDLDHRIKLEQLKRQQEDMEREAYEMAKSEFEKNPDNKNKLFTMQDALKSATYQKAMQNAKNTFDMELNAEKATFDGIIDILDKYMFYTEQIEAAADKFRLDINRLSQAQADYVAKGMDEKAKQLQALIDYLKIMQESAKIDRSQIELDKSSKDYKVQRSAIQKDYEDQIALATAAKNHALAAKLRKDLQDALADVDFDQLSKVMKWEKVFEKVPSKFAEVMNQKKESILKNLNLSKDASNEDIVSAFFRLGKEDEASDYLTEYLTNINDEAEKAQTALGGLYFGFKQVESSRKLEEKASKAATAQEEALFRGAAQAQAQAGIKTMANSAMGIASSFGQAAEFMRDIADSTEDADLAQSAERLSSIAQNFSAAAQGAATGGWIGAIVGGVTDLVGQFLNGTAALIAQREAMKQYYQAFNDELTKLKLTVDEDFFDTIFGTDEVAKAQDAYKKSSKALQEYYKAVRGLNGMKVLTKEYTGIQGWFKDNEYTDIKDLAPQLWGRDGVFSVDNAKAFLNTNKNLSDTQRQQIQNVIDLHDAYEEANKAVDDYISSVTSSMANDMTNAIFDSIRNGVNAWRIFEQAGAEAIDKLGKQMINEMYVKEYLDSFSKEMHNAFGSSNPTESLTRVMSSIYQGLPEVLNVASEAAEIWDNLAESYGFDLQNIGNSSFSATTGVQASFTQDSVDEANGRMASLQMGQASIISQGEEMKSAVKSIADSASNIETYTNDLRDLAAVRNQLLMDIYNRLSVVGANMYRTLSKIETNTANL